MGFEKGSLSFRMFFASRDLSAEDVDKFAAAALPPLSTLAEEEVRHKIRFQTEYDLLVK